MHTSCLYCRVLIPNRYTEGGNDIALNLKMAHCYA